MRGLSVAPVSGTSTSVYSHCRYYGKVFKVFSPDNKDTIPLANRRFRFSVFADDFAELSCRFIPKEAANDTKKWVKLFQEWTCARNAVSSLRGYGICNSQQQLLNGSAILYRSTGAKRRAIPSEDYPALPPWPSALHSRSEVTPKLHG